MQRLASQTSIRVAATTAALTAVMIMSITAGHTRAQAKQSSPLVVRVAVFSSDQGRLDDYQDFIDGHLFPTLRTVPGYVATFIGRDTGGGQLISLSFWRSEADAAAGEDAVSRAIRALPPGSAPRPSKVEKYVVESRDIKVPMAR